jgi:hypothetical protein
MTGNDTNTKGTTMSATLKALQIIGMTYADYDRADFFKRSGRKAAVALRAMGFEKQGFTQMGGCRKVLWAKNNAPLTCDNVAAFTSLVVAVANASN